MVLRNKFEITENWQSAKVRKKRRPEEEAKLIVKRAMKQLFRRFKARHKGFVKG